MTKRVPSKKAITQPTLKDLHDEGTWLDWRSRIPEPLRCTELVTTDQSRAEFLEGARLLRLDKLHRAGDGERGPTPIQLAISDMLTAGYFVNGILEPRRTTKTTSIEAVILGRCTLREDYRVGWTLATTGAKASERFKLDIVDPINRLYSDPKWMPFKINVGKGTESITWRNGSYLGVYAPSGDGFRSGGFDIGWVDEGGEAEPDLGLDLTVSILPTMDTKPGAQFIVSGTAAKYTDGNLLWDTLEDPEAGVIRHGVKQSIDPEELEDWEPSAEHPKARVRQLIELHHPGVGFTTPMDAVRRNFDKFPRELFNAEYLGLFGNQGANGRIIPPPVWEKTALDGPLPSKFPANATVALAIEPDLRYASLGIAWRIPPEDDFVTDALKLDSLADNRPQRTAIAVWKHYTRAELTAPNANKIIANDLLVKVLRKYRVTLVYDGFSTPAKNLVAELEKAAPKPTLTAATTDDVRRSAVKVLQQLEAGTLQHFRQQQQLEHAAEVATKRSIGSGGGFGFGRPRGNFDDITPLEACSLALHFLDLQVIHSTAPADAMHF